MPTKIITLDNLSRAVQKIKQLIPGPMSGADGTNSGAAGLVPAQNATDNTKFLRGDGTWTALSVDSITNAEIDTVLAS